MLRPLVMLFCCFCLISCQSNQTPFTPTAVKKPGNGKIYVYWPGQRYAEKSGDSPEIRLDGVPVGILDYKSYLELEVPAGRYELAMTGDSPDSDWDGPERSFPARVEAGEALYVRLLVKFDQNTNSLGDGLMGYAINFLPRAEKEARLEIYGLKPIAP